MEQRLSPRDCMLFALGIGIGFRPNDPDELQFCFEDGLKVFPAMANVIAHPAAWMKAPELEIDWLKIVHGEQTFSIERPLQPGRSYVGSYRVSDVVDKGPHKGAFVYTKKQLRDQETDEIACTVSSTYVLRGDGGCGSTTDVPRPAFPTPEREPDVRLSLPTLPQAALIYRLSGDYNLIHVDPSSARRAGFARPILHGLCTMGVATRALIQTYCDGQPERLRSVSVRFSAPVYPGETITTDCWRSASLIEFRSRIAERNSVVLSNGRAELAG